MRETDIQAAVMDHWKALGLPGTKLFAIPNARAHGQAGLTPGIFDLAVQGGAYLRDRTGWIELKTERGRISPAQEQYRDFLEACGIPWAVTYGRDQPIRVLEDWGIVRRGAL